LRQIGTEIVLDSKATTCGGVAGYKIEAQRKGRVRADSVLSLIIVVGERRGLLGWDSRT